MSWTEDTKMCYNKDPHSVATSGIEYFLLLTPHSQKGNGVTYITIHCLNIIFQCQYAMRSQLVILVCLCLLAGGVMTDRARV